MSSDKNYKIIKTGKAYILYDASMIAEPGLSLFDRDYHTKPQAQQNNSAAEKSGGIGRARVVYFSQQNRSLVLKHYYRGGLVAAVVKDRYLGFDIEKSRAFREWRLLKKMAGLGLPVPAAVAARVEKSWFFYRADLITEEIKQAQTLADVLSEKNIDAGRWQNIGACIKSFHQHNVYHADLNARNILLAGDNHDVYLIDFDNSDIRADAASWKAANLARLHRSLCKFKKNRPAFKFDDADWAALLAGYDGAVA